QVRRFCQKSDHHPSNQDSWANHHRHINILMLIFLIALAGNTRSCPMLFDVFFFGFPVVLIVVLAGLAIRDEEPKFWPPAICLMAYCVYYLFGGREVLLYLATAAVGCSILI